VLSSPPQVVQTHQARLEALHEQLGVWKACSHDGEALDYLVANGRPPVAKGQIVFEGGIFALLVEKAKLDCSSNEDAVHSQYVQVDFAMSCFELTVIGKQISS
jgi:hypothetical protein